MKLHGVGVEIDIAASGDWEARIADAVGRGATIVVKRRGVAVVRIIPEVVCADMERRFMEQEIAVTLLRQMLARVTAIMPPDDR